MHKDTKAALVSALRQSLAESEELAFRLSAALQNVETIKALGFVATHIDAAEKLIDAKFPPFRREEWDLK